MPLVWDWLGWPYRWPGLPVLSLTHRSVRFHRGESKVKILLELLRLFHKVIGITAPQPEQERTYLFVWIGLAMVLMLLGIGLFLAVAPKIIH